MEMEPVLREWDQAWGGYWGVPYGTAAYDYGVPLQAAPFPYTAPWGLSPGPGQELDALKEQAEFFNDALEGINKRIQEIEAEEKKK